MNPKANSSRPVHPRDSFTTEDPLAARGTPLRVQRVRPGLHLLGLSRDTLQDIKQPRTRPVIGTNTEWGPLLMKVPPVAPAAVMQPRPEQPDTELLKSELAKCTVLAEGWARLSNASHRKPVLVTYATDVASPVWSLGLSAAVNRVPMVLVGHGMQWGGLSIKLPGTLRASQLVNAVSPEAPILFADAADTLISNNMDDQVVARIHAATSNAELTFGGECSSFPQCYTKLHKQSAWHQTCRARSAVCYPNTGAYLLANASTAMRILPLMYRITQALPGPIEKGEDQAAGHHLLATQADHNVTVQVDDAARLILNLFPCNRGSKKMATGETMCSYASHNPSSHVSVDGNAWTYASKPLNANGSSLMRPLLVHASGQHSRLEIVRRERGGSRQYWETLLNDSVLLAYPILLVDADPERPRASNFSGQRSSGHTNHATSQRRQRRDHCRLSTLEEVLVAQARRTDILAQHASHQLIRSFSRPEREQLAQNWLHRRDH